MSGNYILLAFFWFLYCVLHSVLADNKVKIFLNRNVVFKLVPYRIFYNIWAFLSLTAVLFYQFTFFSDNIFNPGFLTQLAGVLLSFSGFIIMIICIKKYFRQLSGLEESYTDVLQVSGIHTIIRHPLYAGTFLFIIGLWLLLPSWSNLIAVCIIIIYTLIGIELEEKKLVSYFGDQYIHYKKNVPAILPKLSFHTRK